MLRWNWWAFQPVSGRSTAIFGNHCATMKKSSFGLSGSPAQPVRASTLGMRLEKSTRRAIVSPGDTGDGRSTLARVRSRSLPSSGASNRRFPSVQSSVPSSRRIEVTSTEPGCSSILRTASGRDAATPRMKLECSSEKAFR